GQRSTEDGVGEAFALAEAVDGLPDDDQQRGSAGPSPTAGVGPGAVKRATGRRHRAPGEAERRDEESAALVEHAYWITWSARSSSVCGIVRPSALAVFKLMTRSNFVGCSTGRSPGLPFRIRSTNVAARRSKSRKFGP